MFICNDGAVNWKNFKQPIIADSTIKAEYVAVVDATKEGFWFKMFVAELEIMTSDVIPFYCWASCGTLKAQRTKAKAKAKVQST